jgi:hypothetical protein
MRETTKAASHAICGFGALIALSAQLGHGVRQSYPNLLLSRSKDDNSGQRGEDVSFELFSVDETMIVYTSWKDVRL